MHLDLENGCSVGPTVVYALPRWLIAVVCLYTSMHCIYDFRRIVVAVISPMPVDTQWWRDGAGVSVLGS